MTPASGLTAAESTGAVPIRVFVYGTLRPGGVFWTQALVGRVTEVSPTVRVHGLHLVNGPGYPMAVRASDRGTPPSGVVGEILYIPAPLARAVLGDLDRIEGVPHLFERVTMDSVWVYVATADTAGRSVGAGTGSGTWDESALAMGSVVTTGDWFDVAPAARRAWQTEMGRDYSGA